jgi:hypothetical protein
MKQRILTSLTPIAVSLYKSFQQKHPVVALAIGGTVMFTWGALTAVTQSGILQGTPMEEHVGTITNALSFLGMGVNLLLSASNIPTATIVANKGEVFSESKEKPSTTIVVTPATMIKQSQLGSIRDVLNKTKK